MFLLGFIICSMMFYSYWRFITTKKIIDTPTDVINYMFTNNIEIMRKIGYYNININETKAIYIYECIIWLLFSHTSNNIVTHYDFSDEFEITENIANKLYNDFEFFCKTHNKSKYDLTINEICAFIKTQVVYKKLDAKLNYTFARAIILSKYLNDDTTKNLLNVLTDDEKNILIS